MGGRRKGLFESVEGRALRPLPGDRYEFATWRKARVNIDYHIEADRHYYSVPHHLAGQKADVRLSAATVEIFHSSRRGPPRVSSSERPSPQPAPCPQAPHAAPPRAPPTIHDRAAT